MSRKEYVIIFTKNRPETLFVTLDQLTHINRPIIVLDDSTDINITGEIKHYIKRSGCIYHGSREQLQLLTSLNKFERNVNHFFVTLGTTGWTLGYNRNYAILLAKALCAEKILMMDDDIIINNRDLIDSTFKMLNMADFVGARVVGMPDDSVLGFISRELGLETQEFFSGGFLAFNLSSVCEYFLNYYNEDWIWLFMHKSTAKLIKHGEVTQIYYNPFEGAIKKALSQELGEILLEGVKISTKRNEICFLLSKSAWGQIIEQRIEKIKKIIELSEIRKFQVGHTVGMALLDYLKRFRPEKLEDIFKCYFEHKSTWSKLMHNTKFISLNALDE